MDGREDRLLHLGGLRTNCDLLADPAGECGVLIDPGDEAKRLLGARADRALPLAAILLTHSDRDHLGAVRQIQRVTGSPVYAHPIEAARITAAARESTDAMAPSVYGHLRDAVVLRVGADTLTVRHTPGHTPGIRLPAPRRRRTAQRRHPLLGWNRTDGSPGANRDLIVRGLGSRLGDLADETVVWPGHGLPATLGAVRAALGVAT